MKACGCTRKYQTRLNFISNTETGKGWLLSTTANIRLCWKITNRGKHSSLFAQTVSYLIFYVLFHIFIFTNLYFLTYLYSYLLACLLTYLFLFYEKETKLTSLVVPRKPFQLILIFGSLYLPYLPTWIMVEVLLSGTGSWSDEACQVQTL